MRPLDRPPRLGSTRVTRGLVVRGRRPITMPAAMTADLTPHRRAMHTDPISNLGVGLASFDPDPDFFSLLERQRTRTSCSFLEHRHIVAAEITLQRRQPDPDSLSSLPLTHPGPQQPTSLQQHPHRRPRRTTHHTPLENQGLSRSPIEVKRPRGRRKPSRSVGVRAARPASPTRRSPRPPRWRTSPAADSHRWGPPSRASHPPRTCRGVGAA